MLEQKPERENEFARERGVPSTYGEGEDYHGKCCECCHGKAHLQNVPEKASLRGSFPEVRKDKGCHAEIRKGAKNGVVRLQYSEVSEIYDSEVFGDKVLDKYGHSLDENVHQGYENTYFYVLKYLQWA